MSKNSLSGSGARVSARSGVTTKNATAAKGGRLDEFIRAIAEYLTSEVGRKSIELEMGKPDAQKWAKAYQASRCRGYASPEEVAESIRQLLKESEVAA